MAEQNGMFREKRCLVVQWERNCGIENARVEKEDCKTRRRKGKQCVERVSGVGQ